MFCKHCGNQIGDYDKFCKECGNQIIKDIETSANTTTTSKFYSKKKGIVVGVISVLLCVAIIITIVFAIKSPEEILKDNEWYSDIDVDCEYHDWSSIGDGKGYWISADCRKIVFYHYGEAETTSYTIGGGGGVYGPYSYEINSENIPLSAPWRENVWDNTDKWEIIDKDTLKYDGGYYLWDDEKETHCDCDDYDCKHDKTWYITEEYLRIGSATYTSKKPSSLHVD